MIIKSVCFFAGFLALVFSGCKKTTCPDYWQHPDCSKQSRERFYGVYKGTSAFDNGNPSITQWSAFPGDEISQIKLADNIVLLLDVYDTRYFKMTENSRLDGHLYVRQDTSYCGHFTDDSLYVDFWVADGLTATPGEVRTHYVFAGKKK
jgi:hypothetical protein